MKLVWIVVAAVLGLITLYLAGFTTLNLTGQRLLASFIVIMTIWAADAMPLAVSCLLLLTLTSFAVVDGKTIKSIEAGLKLSLSGFSNTVPITVVAGTAFAAVIKSSGLAERIVYNIMKLVAGKKGESKLSNILGALFIADIPASLMIPSAMGRCALYMSMVEGLDKPFKFAKISSGQNYNPFQKAIWIATALIPIIMGGAFLTGAEATIMVGGLIGEATKITQYWGSTFALLFIPAVLTMAFSYFCLVRLFPSSIDSVNTTFIREQVDKLGPMTYKEKYCLVSFIIMIALFMTDKFHNIPAPLILIFMSFALYLPIIGPGEWKKDSKEIAWNGYFIIATALGFSTVLSKFGVLTYFANKLSSLGISNYFLVLTFMIIVTLVVRLGIASITSAAALLVPISIAFGNAAGLTAPQLVAVGWITYAFCRISFFLPHQGAQLIMTFDRDYYGRNDLMKAAKYITLGAAVIYIVWSWLFIPSILTIIS
jgi:Di- and tricarboxylate transporters